MMSQFLLVGSVKYAVSLGNGDVLIIEFDENRLAIDVGIGD